MSLCAQCVFPTNKDSHIHLHIRGTVTKVGKLNHGLQTSLTICQSSQCPSRWFKVQDHTLHLAEGSLVSFILGRFLILNLW